MIFFDNMCVVITVQRLDFYCGKLGCACFKANKPVLCIGLELCSDFWNLDFMPDVVKSAVSSKWDDGGPDDESQRTRDSREALSQLWKLVESKLSAR